MMQDKEERNREVKRILEAMRASDRAFDPEAFASQAKKEVLRQDEVINEVASEIAFSLARPQKNKPIASFLFLGKTGVGKTELGKMIARYAMPKGVFIHKSFNSTSRPEDTLRDLVGDRAVWKNSKPGEITKISPSAGGVIFLDEIDKIPKGHDTLDFLLTPLNEGYVVEENRGQKVDVRKTIWVLAANWEADTLDEIRKSEPDPEVQARRVRDLMRAQNYLRPEILGRINRIFIFSGLDSTEDRVDIYTHILERFALEMGLEMAWIDTTFLADCVKKSEVNSDKGVRGMDGDVRSIFRRPFLVASDMYGANPDDPATHVRVKILSDPFSSEPIVLPIDGHASEEPAAEAPIDHEPAPAATPQAKRRTGAKPRRPSSET